MNKKYIYFPLALLFILVTSCNHWLEVQPSDRVTEKNAFSSLQSFKKVLNGIYIEMNQSTVYGKALSVEFIDILGQYYAIDPESRVNTDLINFDYSGSGNRTRISNIWENLYNLISNTNLLIHNCEIKKDVLPDDYYHLIKGEAIALRAFFHFDLFRLFGPIYTKGNTNTSIPYYTDFVLDVEESLSADDFIAQVISDLKEAIRLLEADPIITMGPKGDSKDSFKQYRTLRMNYYASKALLARVYLYAGDKEAALKLSKEVIEIQKTWFPWIKPEKVLEDRIFSTEVLFSLQNLKRRGLYSEFFDIRNLEPNNSLSPLEDVALSIFDNQRHDYRFMANLQESVLVGNENRLMFNKYEAMTDSLKNQLIPLIRISEVFYIAAESESDHQEGIKHLNKVRNNRGITESSLDYYFFDDLLISEYMREFWGEGQLFYFYKRRKQDYVQSPLNAWSEVRITDRNYVLPIPDAETKYN